jgi:prophage regulatory protein
MNPNEPPKAAHTTHSQTPAKPGKLLRLPLVEERTGFRKTSVYAGMKAGTFPAPVRLSARAVAWREEDIDRWISERTTARGQ